MARGVREPARELVAESVGMWRGRLWLIDALIEAR